MKRVSAGETDFCLTSVHHYLTARAQEGALACRFVAVVVQQSPLAAVVASDSRFHRPADLAGARVAAPADGGQFKEFMAALGHLSVADPVVVTMAGEEARAALGAGEVDAVVSLADGMPRIRRQAGIPVRPIPVALDVYASGLVAGEHVPAATAWQMRASLAAALEAQREHPETGLPELRRRYPEADEDEALEGWRLLAPNIFTGPEPGSMSSGRWHATVSSLSDARQLPRPDPESVYRPDFADVSAPRETAVGTGRTGDRGRPRRAAGAAWVSVA